MEAQQCVELTGTNRSCGLTISLRQHRISSSQSVQDERARTRDWDCDSRQSQPKRWPRRSLAQGRRCRNAEKPVPRFPVVISTRLHPIPSRTRKLSSSEPMVLHGKPCGRVGRCRDFLTPVPTGPKPRTPQGVAGLRCFVVVAFANAARLIYSRRCTSPTQLGPSMTWLVSPTPSDRAGVSISGVSVPRLIQPKSPPRSALLALLYFFASSAKSAP